MKRHILRLPKKARLWEEKTIKTKSGTYFFRLYTYGNQSGFVHLCEIYNNEFDNVASAKQQYYNRTWERFTGESVYKQAINFAIKSKDIPANEKTEMIEQLGGHRYQSDVF